MFPAGSRSIVCKPLPREVGVCRSAAHHLLSLEMLVHHCSHTALGVCGWGFPVLAPSHHPEGKQSQLTYCSAVPFLWAVDFLCWYPFCNIRAFYFTLPLFWINPIIFIKKCYLWLLTHMRDANRSFLICLVSYKEN